MKQDRELLTFDWDAGNKGKNKKHHVGDEEAEEPFFDEKKITLKDPLHSTKEKRFIVIGKTKKKRLLYVVFTKRKKMSRIISARDVNRKEIHIYEEAA